MGLDFCGYTYLFHTCTHSQFPVQMHFTPQKFRGITHGESAPTVSGVTFLQMWEVFDGLSGTNKKKKKARDGKRSAMYRLNCPGHKNNNSWINGTVIGLSLPQNAVHMWSNGFKQTLQSVCARHLGLCKTKNCDSSWASVSKLAPITQNRNIICTFISQERKLRNRKQINQKEKNDFLDVSSSSYIDTRVNLSHPCCDAKKSPNISRYFPK